MFSGSAANVVVGSAAFYIGTYGTSLPDLTDLINGNTEVNWSAFTNPGYTKDGVDLKYTPSFKAITVDEEMAPLDEILNGEKAIVTLNLAEATLENLNFAIAASTLTTGSESKVLTVGSKASVSKYVIGFEGPASGTNLTRVFIGYKARPTGTVGIKYKRADEVIIPVEFELLADSTRAAGDRLFTFVDFLSSAS